MGKRELVLIALFVALGVVVYQFTAPPPPPGSEGVSVGGIFQRMKREVQGARETATAQTSETIPIDGGVRLVRISFPLPNDLTIIGSDRQDILVEMHVTARGFDAAEAKAAAESARIKTDRTNDAVAFTAMWPAGRGNGPRQGSAFINQGTVTITLPKRLLLRVEPHIGQLTVRDVAGIEVMGSRGETRIMRSAGHVLLNHNGGKLEIDTVPSLKLTSRNGVGSIKHVAGTLSMDLTGGDLDIADVAGPTDIEARNAEIVFDAAKTAKPPLRFNGTNGSLRVVNLRVEGRIDGRNAELEVELDAAAPVTIYSTGDDIVVTPPSGGYAVDAVATEGEIVLDDGTLKPSGDGEQRVTGAVRGGGPALTLRATRADIRVRKPQGK